MEDNCARVRVSVRATVEAEVQVDISARARVEGVKSESSSV